MRKNEQTEYKGFVLYKKSKWTINIYKDGKIIGFSNSVKNAKNAIDRRFAKAQKTNETNEA